MSLRDYDAGRFGPLLGVSDEGSAATAIVAAALESPKSQALGSASALEVGVAHDGERLGSIGETPIGPDEFAAIRAAVANQILITTNVGSHVPSWHYLRGPTVDIGANAAAQLSEKLAYYLPSAASGEHRVVPVYLRLATPAAGEEAQLADDLRTLLADIICPSGITADAVLLVATDAAAEGSVVEAALELARTTGVAAVAVGGVARAPSEGRTARPGVLNFFTAPETQRLLRRAGQLGIELRPQDTSDVVSTSNQIWAALSAARHMGAAAGKYSLYPLTLQEIGPVLRRLQGWFSDWTAAPAHYLDLETVDATDVLGIGQAADGARRWLERVAAAEIPVVLLDTADKSTGRRLLKRNIDDADGILHLDEIAELNHLAAELGIEILWAGGVGLDQVHHFGRLGCFGIYVTSAAAHEQAISSAYAGDPALAAEREPTREGVTTTKLQLEAGFLAERLADGHELATLSEAALSDRKHEPELASALRNAWPRFWQTSGPVGD